MHFNIFSGPLLNLNVRRFETFLPLTLTQWGGGGMGFEGNFDFITEILFRFFGFGDFKISIVIENIH